MRAHMQGCQLPQQPQVAIGDDALQQGCRQGSPAHGISQHGLHPTPHASVKGAHNTGATGCTHVTHTVLDETTRSLHRAFH